MLNPQSNANATFYSFDRVWLIPSNRNLTSFKTLLVGFQSSNCCNSSIFSASSFVFTKGSSNNPLIAQGRKKGLLLVVGSSKGSTLSGTSRQSVVSKAWRTARLGNECQKFLTIYMGVSHSCNLLIDPIIIIDPRVAFPSIQAPRKWNTQLGDQTMITYTKISQFHCKAN